MDKLLGILKSRKFYAALIGLIFVFVSAYVPNFPFSQDQVTAFVVLIVSYILGTAVESGLARRA